MADEPKPPAFADFSLSVPMPTLPKAVMPYVGDVYKKKSSRLEQDIRRMKRQKDLLAEFGEAGDESAEEEDSCSIGSPEPSNQEHICEVCGRNEKSPFQLCEHMAIYHSEGQPRKWACIYCKMVFGRRGGLRRHVMMVHMQVMHKCPVPTCKHPGYKCTKALNSHIRNHSFHELRDALEAYQKKKKTCDDRTDPTMEHYLKELVKKMSVFLIVDDEKHVELTW